MEKVITYSFCEPFIDNLAGYLKENYIKPGRDISRIALVFGGKRPALFVKKELAKQLQTSFYPPRFFTIDEFMSYSLRKVETFGPSVDLDACYLLYTLAKKNAPGILKGREGFAQFLPWTREILAFIDQLDLENVDNKSLQNIEANAQIGYSVPEDINGLLQHILTLREAYHQSLQQQQLYSRGLQYYRTSKMIDQIDFAEFDQIVFCNFFYFNRAEEAVVKNLYDRNKATLIFQGDQRRWPVFKRIAKKLDCEILEGKDVDQPKFDLKLYSGFDAHSQVGLVREILKKIKRLDRTVIVLPNADLIVPLLSEITSIVQDFNISMGYPLKRSSLYNLFEFVFQAQLSKKDRRYYTKDYLKTLRHPFVKNLKLLDNATITRIIIHKIEEVLTGKEPNDISGSIFIDLKEIEQCDDIYSMVGEMLKRLDIHITHEQIRQAIGELHELLFKQWESIDTFHSFASGLTKFLDAIVQKSFLKNYPLNINIANKIYSIKDEFLNAAFAQEKFPQEDIFRIFDQKISQEIVALIGSPLKGLQILGLFETRSLNFDNVIVLDVNEGVLPKLNIYEPLIPREVMVSLNLDRLELEEEIQRYQFMRLISSAKNVHLVYQESKDKEKSRFVEELIWDEQKQKNQIDVYPTLNAGFEVKISSRRKSIKKTPEMIATLKKHRYSASSINMYIRNPYEFYLNYVLGLREQEDLLDEPDARHIGTFVHDLLEDSFKPFLNKAPTINKSFRDRFDRIFTDRFQQTFGKSMKSDSFLLRSVLNERLNRFLDNEESNKERSIAQILYLENRFEDVITLKGEPIHFGYIVDRVDQLKDGTIMIIDYKTGSTDLMPKAIDHIATMDLSRESISEHVKSFQIPLYYHYLDKNFKDQPINAALYNLRTLELKKFIEPKMNYSREFINDAFVRALDFVLAEILNPDVDFVDEFII